MKTIWLALFSSLALATASPALEAAKGFETDSIILYQPDDILKERLGSVGDLAAYTKQIQAVCTEFFLGTSKPENLHVIVAVRPGRRSKIWLISSTDSAQESARQKLSKKLEAVWPCEVKNGPVVFAIAGKLAGGTGKILQGGDKNFSPPIPREWSAVPLSKESGPMPDCYLDAIWPESKNPPLIRQAEFLTQILEPTGGKIPRPRDWFYHENHHGSGYNWTLTREDTEGGKKPYTTGVRLQLFANIQEGTGKTPKQFILDFVRAKKKSATKVIKNCEEQDQGLFTRVCLETEEGPHHILYSLFWGSKDLDLAVVSIAGTTKELWDTYAPTFDKMNTFEVIDMKRFEK